MAQHDAILSGVQFSGNPMAETINSWKKTYHEELRKRGLSPQDAAELKRASAAYAGKSKPVPPPPPTAIYARIVDSMGLDDIVVTPDGEVVNHDQQRRERNRSLEAELLLERLGLTEELDRATDRNARELEKYQIQSELGNLQNRWLDLNHNDPRRTELGQQERALRLRLKALQALG